MEVSMRKCAVIIAVAVLLLSFGCRNSGDVLLLYPIGNDERINAVGQQLGFEGGNGEKETPFVLAGNDQLEKLREHVAGGEDFTGDYISLVPGTYDLSAPAGSSARTSGSNWVGIGTADTPFKGIFNGNGSTITGLVMTGDEDGNNGHGFFNFAGDGAEISGLTISGKVEYTGTADFDSGVGLLVGIVPSGTLTISDCHTADGSSVKGATAGGLVGRAESGTSVVIANSTNEADISSDGNPGNKIAGVIAYIKGSAEITDTSNSGDVDAIRYSGGIAGNAWNTTFDNVSNTGTIKGSKAIGGIVGNTRGESRITGAVNDGTIEIIGEEGVDQYAIGGTVGLAQSGTPTIEKSTNSEDITVAAGYNGKAITQVGGIVGDAADSVVIKGCVNNGSFDFDSEAFSADYIAGIAGGISAAANGDEVIGTASDGTRTVNNGSISAKNRAAGIVGYHHGGKITADNNGDISGSMYIGGITGQINSESGEKFEIIDSHNSGSISAENQYAGGIIGYGKALATSSIAISGSSSAAEAVVESTGMYAGGIIACGLGNIQIDDCENRSIVKAIEYVGGIVGGLNAADSNAASGFEYFGVKESKNYGDITSVSSGADDATGNEAGGIAGYLYNGASITGSYSEGTITGIEKVGGIVGQALNAKEISGCESRCSLVASAYDSAKTKTRWIGGIVGIITGRDANSATLVKDCRSNVSITTEATYLAQAGGCVGTIGNKATIEGCVVEGLTMASGGQFSDSAAGFLGLVYKDASAGEIEGSISISDCSVAETVDLEGKNTFFGSKDGSYTGSLTFSNWTAPGTTGIPEQP